MHYVNIYDVGQGYGGPEEGGWWYDVGHPIGSIPVELTFAQRCAIWSALEDTGADYDTCVEAIQFAERKQAEAVQAEWKKRYPYTRKRSSVLGGDDYDVVIEDHFAKPYPETRPHYE